MRGEAESPFLAVSSLTDPGSGACGVQIGKPSRTNDGAPSTRTQKLPGKKQEEGGRRGGGGSPRDYESGKTDQPTAMHTPDLGPDPDRQNQEIMREK